MRHMQDAIQATTAASELSALGGGASAASADPDAPENPADEIARTKALARAFGHIQRADAAGNIVLVPNLTRKLSYWRKALRGLEVPPDDIEWCRALSVAKGKHRKILTGSWQPLVSIETCYM